MIVEGNSFFGFFVESYFSGNNLVNNRLMLKMDLVKKSVLILSTVSIPHKKDPPAKQQIFISIKISKSN